MTEERNDEVKTPNRGRTWADVFVGATYITDEEAEPLSVTAVGGNLTYQWYSGTSGSFSPIPGATNPTYIPPTNVDGNISYYVKVTGDCGFDDSDIVSVIVVIA